MQGETLANNFPSWGRRGFPGGVAAPLPPLCMGGKLWPIFLEANCAINVGKMMETIFGTWREQVGVHEEWTHQLDFTPS